MIGSTGIEAADTDGTGQSYQDPCYRERELCHHQRGTGGGRKHWHSEDCDRNLRNEWP